MNYTREELEALEYDAYETDWTIECNACGLLFYWQECDTEQIKQQIKFCPSCGKQDLTYTD